MMKCIAIDDEPKALEIIERYCKKINYIFLLATFREPFKAIEFLADKEVQVIFLDVDMPGVNGFQFLLSLDKVPMIIFTTAYSNYAVESYDVHAVDYLLKPITFDRFVSSVNKAFELFVLKNKTTFELDFILIKSGAQTHRLRVDDILYLEKNGNYLSVITKDKKILIRENMSDVFALLPKHGFIRIHKSFIVSLKHISTFEVHQITIGNIKIPIGISYRDSLKKHLGI